MEQGSRTIAWAVFDVGERRVAVRADTLKRVVPLPALSRVPGASFALRGTMLLDGVVVPVVGGRRLLGLPPSANCASNRPFWAPEVHVPREFAVVLLRRGRLLAVAVDRVVGVERTPEGATVLHLSELEHLCVQARMLSRVT